MIGVTIEEYKGNDACIFCLGKGVYDFHSSILYSRGSRSAVHPVCKRCYKNIREQIISSEDDETQYDDFDRSGEEWR